MNGNIAKRNNENHKENNTLFKKGKKKPIVVRPDPRHFLPSLLLFPRLTACSYAR